MSAKKMTRAKTTAGIASRTCTAALVLLALAAPARAQDRQASDADMSEARARFARGVQLYREGSLEAALAEFDKANQLAPSYRLQYNMAQVHYELHDYVSALRAYRRYLTYGGDEVPADRRTKVQADISELEGRVAQVTVRTNVPGAAITVDEVRAGLTPLTGALLINPGLRRVSASKSGYLPASVTVNAASGERMQVALDLTDLTTATMARTPAQAPVNLTTGAPPARPRIKTWLTLLTTGALAATTGGFAILTREAQRDFEQQLARVPNTRASIDDARSRMVTFAAVTDALAVGTVVAGAVSLYVGLTEGRAPVRESAPVPRRRVEVSLAPGLAGVQALGRF
jgi:tetratricopeptide (TPR) repeat protein